MMADLIRTSMFCDTNYDDEQHYFDDNIYFNDNLTHKNDTCINFTEFMTRSSDNIDDVSMDTEEQHQQVCQQRLSPLENDVTDSTCKRSVATPEICNDFLSRIASASKVEYNTFNNEAPVDVFCNNYLLPIAVEKQNINEQDQPSACQPEENAQYTRPPYSYAACAVAAIYLIGKKSASPSEMFDKLCSVFDGMKTCRKQQYKKHLSKTLRSNKMFQQVERGIFRVVPGCVDKNVFHRKPCVNLQEKEKYADTIQEHLKIPSMFGYFGIEPVQKVKAPRKKRTKVVRDLLKCRSSHETVKMQSDLRLPHRPCFNNDSDDDENELFSHVPRQNISQESEHSAQTSVVNCSDGSKERISDEQKLISASNTAKQQTACVDFPAPRYVVPTPSACVPLRCQEYHIPYVGTFHLVDMYYNGQVIHQLYP